MQAEGPRLRTQSCSPDRIRPLQAHTEHMQPIFLRRATKSYGGERGTGRRCTSETSSSALKRQGEGTREGRVNRRAIAPSYMDPPLHSVCATPDKWETSPGRGCRPSAKAPTVCRARRRGVGWMMRRLVEERAEEDPDPCLLQTGVEERRRGRRGCRRACEGRGSVRGGGRRGNLGRVSIYLLLGCEIFSPPDPFFPHSGKLHVGQWNGAIVDGSEIALACSQ
jgi:hypothetical protein